MNHHLSYNFIVFTRSMSSLYHCKFPLFLSSRSGEMVLAAWLIKFYVDSIPYVITSSSRIRKNENSFSCIEALIYICNYQGRTSFLLFESLSFNNTIIRMVSVKVEGTYNLSFSYSFPSVLLEFEHCNINLVVSESSLHFSFRILMSCLMEKIQYPNRNSVKCCMMLLFIVP